MAALSDVPALTTTRLRLEAFTPDDAPALAAILAEPDVTKNITANASTPERCRASAEYRIDWYNRSWSQGYGVWAVKSRDQDVAPVGQLQGWCGFAAPDIGQDPEILYGLAPRCWGQGLAIEMVAASIEWLFSQTAHSGISAIIFGRLNPASVRLAGKFGMRRRGAMSVADFMPDLDLARDVLDYEVWRLAHAPAPESAALMFHAAYKGGLIAALETRTADAVEARFIAALAQRTDIADVAEAERCIRAAFRQALADPFVDWYHLSRDDWHSTGGT